MANVFSHLRIDEYQKLTKASGNLKKMQILSKNAKIRDIKMFKTIPLLLETMQCPITNLRRDCLVSEAVKTEK